ncbi:hypothetical protein SAMN06269301_3451 [Geobacter sp. DSM 9736]|nr:hypothetical protein SAMN06269301_3451 [Geobacter sp. DSM 9736]
MLFFTRRRRRRLRNEPLPQGWLQVLEQEVPLYRRLHGEDRDELHGHVQVLLAEKAFEGGGGFAVTERMRLIIAAQACVLLLHREPTYYPRVSSIIVYEEEYLAPLTEVDECGVVTEGIDRRSGEFSPEGALVLSWEDVVAEGLDVHSAYNVVLHEFAHELDAEDGITAGTGGFAEILRRNYLQLKRSVRLGRPTALDEYGAENPAEFFAVATECFFQEPLSLRAGHTELYRALSEYYRQDPAQWGDSCTSPPGS